MNGPGDLAPAELILVGGGNTFQLLRECRARRLLETMGEKVTDGAKYIGWSAGANLACPTIKTTNDMPIVDPGGLDALGLVSSRASTRVCRFRAGMRKIHAPPLFGDNM